MKLRHSFVLLLPLLVTVPPAGAQTVNVAPGQTVSGNPNGLTFAAGGTVNVAGGGTVDGASNGIVSNGGTLTVFNGGRIHGSNLGINLTAGHLELTNNGTITNAPAGGAINVNGSANITNNGLLHGTLSGVTVTGAGTIVNNGTIESVGATGNAVFQESGTFVNRGVVVSRAAMAAGFAFLGGAGDNVVELHAGSQTIGDVRGGLGFDTIRLLGGGTVNGNIDQFELMSVGGDWDLFGTVNVSHVDINAGRLNVFGVLGGGPVTVVVHRGAILGGSGTINMPVDVRPGGAIDPGGSIGTLTINGNLTFGDASTFVVELQGGPNPANDRINVMAMSSVTVGSNVVLRPVVNSGYLRHGDRFTVLTALGGGILGNPFVASRASAVIGVRQIRTATTLTLEIERTPYQQVAQTPNHRRIGLALDSVIDSAGGDLRSILNELDKLQIDEFELALESIDPEFYDVFREVGLMTYRSVAEAVEGHFAEIGEGGGGVDVAGNVHSDWNDLLADGGGRENETHRADGFSVWAGAYGMFAENDEETDVTEFELRSTGPRMGWDYKLSDMFSIGMFAGVTLSDIDFERSNDMEAEHDAYTIGMHGRFEHPSGLAATLMVYGGIDDYEARRVIRFGTIDRVAHSDHDGYHIAGRLAAEYIWSAGSFHLGPVGSLDYLHQGQESFLERGANSLNLRVKEREVDSFETGLGLVFRYRDESPDEGDMIWVPEFRAKWVREWLDDDRTISAALVGGPRLNTRGDDPDRDSAVLGIGFKVHDRSWFSFGLDYDAVLNEDIESHTLRGAFEIRF